MVRKKDIERIQILCLLLIPVVLIAGDWAGNLFVRFVILPAIISLAVSSMIEEVTGDTLKKILIIIRIGRFKFSFTVFALAAVVLKLWLF